MFAVFLAGVNKNVSEQSSLNFPTYFPVKWNINVLDLSRYVDMTRMITVVYFSLEYLTVKPLASKLDSGT